MDENEKVASRRFRLLLYARYVCLRVFLESATAKDGIMANHKGSWLLIQVAPETGPTFFINSLCWREGPPTTISSERSSMSLQPSPGFSTAHLPCFACSMKRRLLPRTWITSDPGRTKRSDPSSVQSSSSGSRCSQISSFRVQGSRCGKLILSFVPRWLKRVVAQN